jgi:import receptor subunit TOM20
MNRIGFGVLASTALLSVGYLIYFDFKRRDPKFRRKIQQEKKEAREEYEVKSSERAAKSAALSAASAAAAGPQLSEEFLTELANEPEPKSLEDKEKYFIKHLDIGEKLLAKGKTILRSL